MMKIGPRGTATLFAAALLVLGAAAPLQGQAVNLTGSWVFEVTTETGTTMPVLTIEHEGDTLRGHYASETLGNAEFTGTVEGTTFRITFPVDLQGMALTVVYAGTIESAERLTGTLDLGGQLGGTFTARPREEP